MNRNLTPLIILLGVQFLFWKGIPLISQITPQISHGKKDSSNQELKEVSSKLQITLKGHALNITSVAITEDNNTVISGSEDNTIKIWNSITGQIKRTLTGHTGAVNYLSVTPNGNYLVSAEDKKIRIWNVQTGTLIRELKNSNGKINFIRASQDKKTLVVDGGTQIIKKIESKVPGSFSDPSESLIEKYLISVYDFKNGNLKSQLLHDNPLTRAETSPNNNILVSGDTTGKIYIWNLENGTLQKTLAGHESNISSIAISPDEKTIVSTDGDGKIKIWDLASGNLKSTFKGHDSPSYESVEVLIPDNNTLATWNVNGVGENSIKIWNLQTGELKYTIKPTKKTDSYLSNPFKFVTVSPDSKNLITQSNNSIQAWDISTGNLINTIKIEDKDKFLTIIPNSLFLTTDSPVGSDIKIWQIPSSN
jgi:WD40 repeat protein